MRRLKSQKIAQSDCVEKTKPNWKWKENTTYSAAFYDTKYVTKYDKLTQQGNLMALELEGNKNDVSASKSRLENAIRECRSTIDFFG